MSWYDKHGTLPNQMTGLLQLSDAVFLRRNQTIGNHENVFEGEIRSAVFGVRCCVIKFARVSEQIVREAEILTQLGSHTNIVAIIQSGTYQEIFGDRMYIVLDKCYSKNLHEYMESCRANNIDYDLDQALDFVKQIIVGVTHIHNSNVIHLDLKPSNILISQNLRLIKIADFGQSIIVKSPKSKVFHKNQFGTNGFRSVESFGNSEVSQRTDIFSLGIVLLHVLSNGNYIFGRNEHDFIHNVMDDVTDTSGLLVRNPFSTEHLIKCMVNKERCRRPTIWEVSDHPCWNGTEVECNFEYFSDDEIDDNVYDVTVDNERQKVMSSTEIDREKKFLKRMREMGFNRKPTILLFDNVSACLYRFDQSTSSIIEFCKYHSNAGDRRFSAVSHDEYIYEFHRGGSVYRLEYGDAEARWEELSKWFEDHGHRPPAVASSDAIYLVGSMRATKANKSVSRYTISKNVWENLEDKPTASYGSALLCNKEFLYCIGGLDESYKSTNTVERMNLQTLKWTRLESMKQRPETASAAEHKGNIYVVGGHFLHMTITLQLYNPQIGTWTEIHPQDVASSDRSFNVFEINSNLFVVGTEKIQKYDIESNEWSIVMEYPHKMRITESVLVKLSR